MQKATDLERRRNRGRGRELEGGGTGKRRVERRREGGGEGGRRGGGRREGEEGVGGGDRRGGGRGVGERRGRGGQGEGREGRGGECGGEEGEGGAGQVRAKGPPGPGQPQGQYRGGRASYRASGRTLSPAQGMQPQRCQGLDRSATGRQAERKGRGAPPSALESPDPGRDYVERSMNIKLKSVHGVGHVPLPKRCTGTKEPLVRRASDP